MQLTKRDLVTMVVLSIVFFSMATWSLGMTKTPVTTVQFSNAQGFTVDIGTVSYVRSVVILLKEGSFNLSVSTGSPGSWQSVSMNVPYPYDYAKESWGYEYYKWYEVRIQQNTQYLKVDFSQSANTAEIAEIGTINATDKITPIVSVTSADGRNMSALVDEQNLIQYPSNYLSQTYFDEIYFARTAEQYLNHQWPYEWTHPPLGKLIQAASIAVLGFNPFGWRFVGVLFATLMIPIIYVIGKKLFGTWIGAFAAAFLLTFDFMHFTMGRMGTADTYLLFFNLLSQLFFVTYFLNVIKNGWKTSVLPLFLAVIFFILAFSTKWVAIYSAIGMLALLFALRIRDIAKIKDGFSARYVAFFERPFLLLIGFIAVAAGIYFLIYVPDMIIGRPFFGTNGVIDLQFAMYRYHSTLTETHTFMSPWWSWPLMFNPHPGSYVPLWLGVWNWPNDIKSTISVFGNPAVWWVGFASIIVTVAITIFDVRLLVKMSNAMHRISWLRKTRSVISLKMTFNIPSKLSRLWQKIRKPSSQLWIAITEKSVRYDVSAIYIAVVFFFCWIPYVFISRATFIYHFYLSTPFLCLAPAYLINRCWHTNWGKAASVSFFVTVVVLFAVFYPVISGMPAPINWIDKLKLFPSWYF